jgi:bifunctional non-homologous end joining protein LigD
MALESYRRRRDFSATPEPRGGTSRKDGDSFVVQKHAAGRLHYDLRLEMGRVLKSWAVAKGPSLTPGAKRLAVHVEDHPLDYGDFEGRIPRGEYGAGPVIIWDRGYWTPIGDPHKGYAKGHLDFELHGEKLNGRWHLVRMRAGPREKRENWLLIKGDDEFARTESAPDILDEWPESVKTGRDVVDVEGEPPGWSSKTGSLQREAAPANGSTSKMAAPAVPDLSGARKGPLPAFVEPMLASSAASPPSDARWIHEIKFDGYRLQARIEAGAVKLLTRGGLDWTAKFGKEIIAAFRGLNVGSALIDGELVVETDSGASDFSALQADLSAGRSDRFRFYAFDLLYLDGHDLRASPLIERKMLLLSVIGANADMIRFSEYFEENGALVLRHCCRLSLEGIVSKLKDAPYHSGRDRSWLKSKCSARQEFVIGGYVPSTTQRKAVGSLVLGVYDRDALEYVGRVGTGFSAAVAEELFDRLERMRVASSPFAKRLSAEGARGVRYVRPKFVAEVEFRAWTADGLLRHASFRGLREDKTAREVLREPVKTPAAETPLRRTVMLTHADRGYWPDLGVTKEGLADYYTEVWPYMAPFVVGRPLALLRCPDGVEGEHFFQKHAWKGLNSNIVLVQDPKEPSEAPLISVNDLDGLMGLVQAAVLEIHPWGARVSDWERPDLIVMDLDPGEQTSWADVIGAAEETRRRLEDAGLAAFVKTSGGKGLHVVSPLKPKAKWPVVKAFAKRIADAMAADSPERFVATIAKTKRRGKILVDYLRNQRGATVIAPYSTRARPGAAVSAPLAWEELSPGLGPAYFTVLNTPTRLAALKADPWDGFFAAAAPLEQPGPRRRKAVNSISV